MGDGQTIDNHHGQIAWSRYPATTQTVACDGKVDSMNP
jgi:hypothetical protein